MARNRTALAQWLEREGVTQQELARRLGVSQPKLHGWVHGAETNYKNLRKLHKVTGISYAELVGDRK